MRHLRTKMLIKEVAKNNNVNAGEVQEVIECILGSFPKHVMSQCSDREKGYFPTIRIPFFGAFYVSPRKKHYLDKMNKPKNKKKDESI